MSGDIFHVHYGVIHQQPQGQDECEESNAVDRITQHQVGGQRQSEYDRHRNRHDERLAPSKPDCQKRDDNQDGNGQSFE